MMVTLLFTGCATIRKLNPIESSTLEARRLTQQAESAIHKSNWDEAEQKLISAIEKNPEDKERLYINQDFPAQLPSRYDDLLKKY